MSEIEPPAAFATRHGLAADDVPVAVLPGSRRAEIEHILPVILRTLPAIAAAVPGARFIVPTPSATIRESVQRHLAAFFADPPAGLGPDRIVLAESGAISCLANARMGIVKSMSTLQAALAGTPFVMVYRTTPVMWRLSRLILRNAHFAIVNLIAGRAVVPELMQDQLNPDNLARHFSTFPRSGHLFPDEARVGRDRRRLRRSRRPAEVWPPSSGGRSTATRQPTEVPDAPQSISSTRRRCSC